ncbi:hypothetical protein ACWEGX_31540 [Streptomyces chartreusis]
MLRDLGATDAADPVRERVLSCTPEGGSGLVDMAFFEDSHE